MMRRINGIGHRVNTRNKPSRCFLYINLILVLTFTFSPLFSTSQEKDNWSLYKEQDGIKIFTQTDEFHDNANGLHYEYVIIKITNSSSRNKKLSLTKVLYYNGNKIADDDNSINTLYINSGNSLTGSVDEKSDGVLRIFRRFLNYSDKPVLTGFEITINAEDL